MRYLFLFLVLLFMVAACAGEDSSSESEAADDDSSADDDTLDDDSADDDSADDDMADDDTIDDDTSDDDTTDDDTADDDTADDDTADDDTADDDTADDDTVIEPIFNNPHDDRLYVAAGYAVITPNNENHPCVKYLAGTSHNRLATGVHDDLEARMIVLERNGVHVVMASLDLVGVSLPDIQNIHDELAGYGVDPSHVIFSSTHTHEGPDTMGLWGRDYLHSGRCPNYMQFLQETIVGMVVDLAGQMTPVTVEAAATEINDPLSAHPHWQRDSRQPEVFNDHLTAARFIDEQQQTVATLVNWSSHPEVIIWSHEYSADFPRWTRQKLDETYGGTTVYFTGTCGGLLTPLNVEVPERTETGEPVYSGGDPVYISTNNEVKMWSLGYVLAEQAIAALAEAEPFDVSLSVETADVEIPFTNPFLVAAFLLGLVPPYEDLITDRPWQCGYFGCFQQTLQHVQLGDLHFVSLPGEAFAEMSVGREESVYDWGGAWGEHLFPAITGYRQTLPVGHLLMDIGLANNEIGYIVPNTDMHPAEHPDHYEEWYCVSWKAEAIVRETIIDLLSP